MTCMAHVHQDHRPQLGLPALAISRRSGTPRGGWSASYLASFIMKSTRLSRPRRPAAHHWNIRKVDQAEFHHRIMSYARVIDPLLKKLLQAASAPTEAAKAPVTETPQSATSQTASTAEAKKPDGEEKTDKVVCLLACSCVCPRHSTISPLGLYLLLSTLGCHLGNGQQEEVKRQCCRCRAG